MIRMTALMLATVGIVTASADAALIDVGFTTSESPAMFDQEAENYLDQVEVNDGSLPSSPSSIDVNKIIEPNGLIATSSIIREDGETAQITLDNVLYDQTSDDDAMVFTKAGSLAGFDYSNNVTLRGRRVGDDDELFTNDDVILTDGDENADYIGIFAVTEGSTFANNEANRTYFNAETPFEVETTVELQSSFDPDFTLSSKSETVTVEGEVVVPEPSTITLSLIGFGTLALSRTRRSR